MRATWYVLEDGNIVDPAEVYTDGDGKLTHKGGVKVAMKGDVPHSHGVDLGDPPKGAEKPKAKGRQAKADDDKLTYKTR